LQSVKVQPILPTVNVNKSLTKINENSKKPED